MRATRSAHRIRPIKDPLPSEYQPSDSAFPGFCLNCQSVITYMNDYMYLRPYSGTCTFISRHGLRWRQGDQHGCPLCKFVVQSTRLFSETSSQATVEFEDDSVVTLQPLSDSRVYDGGGIRICPGEKEPRRMMFFCIDATALRTISQQASSTLQNANVVPLIQVHCSGHPSVCLERMALLFKRCREGHQRCRVTTSALPARVIDIEGPSPRLIRTAGQRADYIAVSHRWQDNMPKTTTSNYTNHLEAIPTQLPKTYLDAFSAAKFFGIRYIWIDSLCIIQEGQDSEVDKVEQCSKMADIFGGSYICFAISGPHSKGLFYPDHHAGSGPFMTETKVNELIPSFQVPSLNASVIETTSKRPFATNDDPSGILAGRGWCHQELFLAPRIICFQASQFEWICHEDQRSCLRGLDARSLNSARSTAIYNVDQPDKELYDAWCEEVERYSRKAFTYDEDRLPAFAGMARHFQARELTSPYVAGIWLQHAARELSWRTCGVVERRPLRAPSFSWASIEGQIEFEMPDHELEDRIAETIDVISGSADLLTPDYFGAVKGGQIQLGGYIFSGTYCMLDDDHDDSRHALIVESSEPHAFHADIPGQIFKHGEILSLLSLYILVSGPYDDPRFDHCLLVLRQASTALAVYERIGIMTKQSEHSVHSVHEIDERGGAAVWQDKKFALKDEHTDLMGRLAFPAPSLQTITII